MKLFTTKGYGPNKRFAWFPVSIPQHGGGSLWIWWEYYYERDCGTHTEVWQ